MNPLGYLLPEVVLSRFVDLLRINCIAVIESERGRFILSDGREALIIDGNRIKERFVLPEPEWVVLHVALLSSGAEDLGFAVAGEWPSVLLFREEILSSVEEIASCLQIPLKGNNLKTYSGVFEVFGGFFVLAVRISKNGGFETVIVPKRAKEERQLRAWDEMIVVLAKQNFQIEQLET